MIASTQNLKSRNCNLKNRSDSMFASAPYPVTVYAVAVPVVFIQNTYHIPVTLLNHGSEQEKYFTAKNKKK